LQSTEGVEVSVCQAAAEDKAGIPRGVERRARRPVSAP